jgi:NTP pyrophosphatase (non-canonical NTP hydrolase)
LLNVMRRLRAPGGCPWDQEQTHESLREYLLEEAAETVDAISNGELEELPGELGDVLLQVAFHSVIAEEAGTSLAKPKLPIPARLSRTGTRSRNSNAPENPRSIQQSVYQNRLGRWLEDRKSARHSSSRKARLKRSSGR